MNDICICKGVSDVLCNHNKVIATIFVSSPLTDGSIKAVITCMTNADTLSTPQFRPLWVFSLFTPLSFSHGRRPFGVH